MWHRWSWRRCAQAFALISEARQRGVLIDQQMCAAINLTMLWHISLPCGQQVSHRYTSAIKACKRAGLEKNVAELQRQALADEV